MEETFLSGLECGETFFMKKFKGILFDFDGVIGKTMEDNYSALEKLTLPVRYRSYKRGIFSP